MSLSFALRYQARGLRVFPIAPRGKVPAIPKDRGGRGVLDATIDAAQAVEWWKPNPSWGVGIAAGPSGLVIVDVDERHDGPATMRSLVARFGRLPETARVRSPGGWHLYYAADANAWKPDANALGVGVDVRAGNSYVCAPPSVHPSGQRYRWIAEIDPAPLPAWMAEVAAEVEAERARARAEAAAKRAAEIAKRFPQRRGAHHVTVPVDVESRARRWLACVEPSIQGQNGSGRAMHAAVGLVRGFCLDPRTALDLLLSEFNPRCTPPWSERELIHKVESAEHFGQPLGYLLDAPRRVA